jgi:hypothetical protein
MIMGWVQVAGITYFLGRASSRGVHPNDARQQRCLARGRFDLFCAGNLPRIQSRRPRSIHTGSVAAYAYGGGANAAISAANHVAD